MTPAVKTSLRDKKLKNLEIALKSRESGESQVSHYPLVIYLESTSICNLSCPMCPITMGVSEYQYEEPHLSLALIEKLREPLEHCLRCFLSGGGEPLLHPEFLKIIELVKQLGIEVVFNTNATLVDEEFSRFVVEQGVDCISVSIDAIGHDEYRRIRRGGELEQVLEGLRLINREKEKRNSQKPYLNMQFTLMKENLAQVDGLVMFAARQRINHLVVEPLSPIFSFDRQYQAFFQEHFQPLDQGLAEALGKLKKESASLGLFFSSHYLEQMRAPKKCAQPWINFGIRTNGRAFLCCGTAEKMGSLNEGGFQGIWNGPAYQLFRKEIGRGEYPEPCALCLKESRSPWFNHELLEQK
jgi:MoaA/NifB/PqqE/SkfB family radical SAM enzyme